MKLTKSLLEKLVKEEMSLLGGAKAPEDVDATEVDADEFGTDKALEKKKDFTVKESYDMIRALNLEERRLVTRLKKVREQKVAFAKRLIK